ncbi:uncharacterized protein LOC132601471 [Lycium barbarum]|uniref:uncharacterized protein LOC132601471 n=1 Tax=Lycium barbarum TaxID=112863 RepID=UPI00293E8811|nr:uncharacterized protein LOC132601471 [Lycium barbarum]
MTGTPDSCRNELILHEGDTQDPQEISSHEDVITTLLISIMALQEKVARNEVANADKDGSTEGKMSLPLPPSLSSPMPDHFPIYPPGTIPPPLNPTNPNHVPVSINSANQVRVPAPPTGKTTTALLNHLTHQVSFFTSNIPNESSPGHKELDHYAEMDKAWRAEQNKRERDMEKKMKELLERSNRSARKAIGLRYDDLCMHQELDLLEGFKIQKFEMFNGTRNPKAHLRSYYDQLVGVKTNDPLIM